MLQRCILALLLFATVFGVAQQKRILHVYSSLPEVEVKEYVEAFEKKYPDIDVVWVRLSTGAMLARIRAEAANPQASLWFGGPTDSYMVATREGLFMPYKESLGWQYMPSLYKDPDGYWTGFGINYLCFVSNINFLKAHGLEPPTSWYDLLRPEFKGRISTSFPYTSGTGYARLATLVFLFGEDEAFNFEIALSRQILEYTESGPGCIPKVGLGEAAVGITYISDVLAAIAQGYPIVYSFPKEGTSYTTDCVALIRGGPEPDLAKIFYDWLLSAEAQELFKKFYRIGLNPSVEWPEGVRPPVLVDYDFAWAAANRDRLINKWRQLVGF